jgi:hypothetical protein
MKLLRLATLLSAPCLLAGLAHAGDIGIEYHITIRGEVEFNGITSGPLTGIQSGDKAEISFKVHEDFYTDDQVFPTRGYALNQDSFEFSFPGGTFALQSPQPSFPMFVLRDNDPAVDGFFLSSNTSSVGGIPLNFPAPSGGQLEVQFLATYPQERLPSLDIPCSSGP